MDALFYIYLLKLKLEAIKREYSNLVAIKEEYLKILKHIHIHNKVYIIYMILLNLL